MRSVRESINVTILNPLDRIVLVTLIKYSNSKDHVLTIHDILELDAVNTPFLQVESREFELFLKEIRVNGVSSMVYLSDLEWSSMLIEGLWCLAEKLNNSNYYRLESTETLRIVTTYILASTEKISKINYIKSEPVKSSPVTLSKYLSDILYDQSIISTKLNI